jgi:hypothetical protein
MRSSFILFSLLLVTGCSAGPEREEPQVPVRSVDLVKVTYVRFNLDPKTGRYHPVYQVLISNSWKRKFGNNPREPYSKLFPRRGKHAPLLGIVPDREMRSFRKKLWNAGLPGLVSVAPEEVDLVALSQVRLDRTEPPFTRIITVGNGTESRSWLFRGNNYSLESIRQFVQCEKLIIRMGELYAAKIGFESLPVRPGER